MFIKPAPGMSIIDPDLRDRLPAEGRDVPETPYWHRMKLAGDVVEAVPSVAADESAAPSRAAKAASK